uniref:non-specific serine/threonine protein kinase n=1 Tax=Phallusia mammillata TaxID=59560 RepID=A0A6F9DNA2_9ASCI|nr:PAS domain-containing serine/threonine-protein kinase [Phallusia mammillata]
MYLQSSFEHNQSYPRVNSGKKSKVSSLLKSITKFTGDEINSCSYSYDAILDTNDHDSSFNGSNKSHDLRPSSRQSFGKSMKKMLMNDDFDANGALSKSVLTLDAETLEVLTANRRACNLFGYSPKSLIGMKMSQLFRMGSCDEKEALMHDISRPAGNVVVTCGKVMEAISGTGKDVPVSVWMKKVKGQNDQLRCIVVLQPVIRVVGEVSFNSEGQVLNCDDNFSMIHGYSTSSSVVGCNIHQFLPMYKLPQAGKRIAKDIRKQRTTGQTCDGQMFPISVYVQTHEKDASSEAIYTAAVWFFTSINGLLSINKDGDIEGINNNFSLAMLGYRTEELKSMNIAELLPSIGSTASCLLNEKNEIQNADFSETLIEKHSEADSSSQSCGTFELIENVTESFLQLTTTSPGGTKPRAAKQSEKIDNKNVDESWVELTMNQPGQSCIDKINSLLNGSNDILANMSNDSAVHSNSGHQATTNVQNASSRSPPYSDYQSDDNCSCNVPGVALPKRDQFAITSTPFEKRVVSRLRSKVDLAEGHHEGQARHKNGTLIEVEYEVVSAKDNYFVWMRLKNHEPFSCNSSHLCSSFNSTLPSLNASAVSGMLDFSLGAAIKQEACRHNNDNVPMSHEGDEEWHAVQGEFNRKYDVTKSVGNGAFGFVKLACRKSDGKKVVVKFIRKEKILEECWVEDYETDSEIPLEISLLIKFRHENVIRVTEFFENERFFSMIMPQHGEIDLFEFIDRSPRMDETLASYIYRQVVSGVKYLHRQGIVHRDIKDENVIIDRNFSCKLIDFGSAAFYKPGTTFATFCGTIEYCSPEVLLGNRYDGPELDMWALGVTLYTLVFGENPFQSIEETIEAELKPPTRLSDELMSTIRWLLQPVPEHRCTMNLLLDEPWVNLPFSLDEYSWDEVFRHSDESAGLDKENISMESLERSRGIPNAEKVDLPKHDDIFPLRRRLENVNLNHSI